MSKDLNKIKTTNFTIQFSQIRCKIHRQDETFISLVIKIGKNSSKYTEKKLLKNNLIEFKEVLKVNIKQKQLQKENGHPNKCEILFYRMTTQFEQQKSSVIGIASLKITNDLFMSQAKKVRITNTFDKEAFLECRIKIYSEQTDLMSNDTDFSSAAGQQSDYATNGYELHKSEGSSFLNAQKSTNPQIDKGQIQRQQLIQNFPKLKRNINQIDNSYQRKINQRQNIESQRTSRRGSIVRNQSSIISGKSKDNNQRIPSIQLLKTCKQLENQNNILMNKIIRIQNNLSLKQETTTGERKSRIRKNSRQQNKPLMIKKNSKIKNQSCIVQVKRQTQKEQEMANIFYIGQLQKLQQKAAYCETQREPKLIDLVEQQSFDRLYNGSMDQAPNCESRKFLELQHQQSMTYLAVRDCAKQMTQSLNCTFADERRNPKSQMLGIMKVLSLTVIPEKQNNEDKTFIANKSISEIQRSHTRSYSKFNERKKSHQKIGVIRKSSYEEQDFPIQFKLNSSNFNGQQMKIPFVVQRYQLEHEQNFEKDSFEVKSNRFLDENDELSPMIRQLNIKVKQKRKPKNNKRVNLQEVYQNMKERYLRNQRDLRKVNELLLNENKRLKLVQKQLHKQLMLKRQLEIEDFNRMKDQTLSLQKQIEQYLKVIQQKDIRINFSVLKYEQLQKQCHKLKKELKEQKQAASYFVKLNNMMDEKQKGKQKHNEKQKNFFNRSQSQIQLNQSQLSTFNIKNNSPQNQSPAEKKRTPEPDPYQRPSMLNLNDLYGSTNSIEFVQSFKKDQKKQFPKRSSVQKDGWKNGRLQRNQTLPQSSGYIKDIPDSQTDRRVNNYGRQKISNPGSPIPENNLLKFSFPSN